VSIKQDIN